jgi:short-subunit dehydrogenase
VAGGSFEETGADVWDRVMAVNFGGVLHGTQAAYSQMLQQGFGHIVNTASTAGLTPVAKSVAYSASKHAVAGLTTSLRAEAAGTGVRLSVVVPGMVATNIFDSATNVGDYDYVRAMKRVPFKWITAEQAAAYILDGVAKDKQFITFPAYNRVLVGLNRLAPSVMSGVINR